MSQEKVIEYLSDGVESIQVTVGTSTVQASAVSVPVAQVWIKALAGNVNTVFVGGNIAMTVNTGYPLLANASLEAIPTSNLNRIFMIAGLVGQVVSIFYTKRPN